MIRRAVGAALAAMACASGAAARANIQVREDNERIAIETSALQAAVRKRGYVSGIEGGSFVDRKTGFRDAGFGLEIVDWVMEPGSDAQYRNSLPGDLKYEFNNPFHGRIPKRSIEGPQICTQAKELQPRVIRGKDFVAVRQRYAYRIAAPGRKAGSVWEQTLVFPQGRRYFLSTDQVTVANAGRLFLRLDMPGHIRHQGSDTFSEVYLSYVGRIPATAFNKDFAPDERFLYRRGGTPPKRFIRAYHLRDPKTGKDGPWLAGMTLNPDDVHEAWCHERGYVCMIEEFGGRPVKPGDKFSAAFLVGYFDSIAEMETTYDRYAGHSGLAADSTGWRLTMARSSAPSATASPPADERAAAARLSKRLEWFQDQKFGFFVHWGVYSQWGCIESWPLVEDDKWARPEDLPAWVERGRDINRFRNDYWRLNRTFRPRRFDPSKWAEAAKRAGMKYFVFTTKHHDGFSMFDTRQTNWRVTSPDCPFSADPRSNVTRELFDAFRARGFGIGAYFSKADWHHPDYWAPEAPARTRNPNYDTLANPERWARFVDFTHNQIQELMTGYGPIDILWLDAGQVRPPTQDIQMDRLVMMARSRQPGLIVVDRTVGGNHENYRTPEQEVPKEPLPFVWETCMTLGDQWSYKPNDQYKSTRQLVHLLVDVVAKGGNFLLNVGPNADGELPDEALRRMREIGDWLRINGEAIYGTRPVAPYKIGRAALTHKGKFVYAIVLLNDGESLPETLALPGVHAKPGSARVMGRAGVAPVRTIPGGVEVDLTGVAAPNSNAVAIRLDLAR